MRRQIMIAAVLSVVGAASMAGAQNAAVDVPAKGRTFEVASVRMSDDSETSQITIPEGTQVTERRIPMRLLVQLAFGVEDSQITGPDWFRTSYYDVVAKLPEGVSLTNKQMRVPLQQLLMDRFGLKFHHETKEKNGYALVMAKGGPKLTLAKEGAATGGTVALDSVCTLKMRSATIKTIAAFLTMAMQQPVVDKTGLDGDYEVTLSFASLDAKNTTMPSVYTAVQEQLGLKLESQKVPVETLVIDHVEKVPTEN